MISKKKILIVSRCTWTLFVFRKNLILELKMLGMEVAVAASSSDGYLEKVRSLGVYVYDLPLSSRSMNPWNELVLIRSLVRVYKQYNPDVVHHFTIKPVIFGSIAAKLVGLPRVVNTITGLGYAFTNGGWLLENLVSMLYRFALKNSSHVFFQNTDDQQLFLERNLTTLRRSSLVAGSGVDLDFYSASRQVCQGEGPVVFLFVGRILRDKGIDEFIAAAELSKQQGADAIFRILGGLDNSNPSVLREDEFRSRIDRAGVEWLGHSDEVRSKIDAADVVVLPSYREGTPRSLLEGAAMGRAIITTDAVGCREVLDANLTGISVPIRSIRDLAAAFLKLSSDRELLISMGEAGRKKMEREFSEVGVIEKTISQYNLE